MRLSVFFDHVREAAAQTGKPLREVLSLCRAEGVEGLEIRDLHLREREAELSPMLKEVGLQISCVYGMHDLGCPGKEGLASARETLRLAGRHGCRRVLLVPGALEAAEADALNALSPEDTAAFMARNPAVCRMRDRLRLLVAEAEQHQVTVTLEDFDGAREPYARRAQLRWFMEQVPGLRFTLDTGNFAFSDEDVLAAQTLLAPWVAHVHCKDRGEEPGMTERQHCRGLAPVAVGDGYLPVDEVVRRLKAGGYQGFLAIEHFGARDQLEAIRRSARYLSGLLMEGA